MTAPTLGLAVIVRDEEENLPHLLASVAGAFDQVAVLDTGSTDRTVEVFEQWADVEVQSRGTDCRLGQGFEWRDDFAAARNMADDLLETDWLLWADADDEIVGAERLRPGICELAARGVRGIIFDYDIQTEEGIQRMRARDRGVAVSWEGRLHEGLYEDAIPVDARRIVERSQGVFWRHRSRFKPGRDARNLRIIRRWIAEQPADPRPHAMLAEYQLRFIGDRVAAVESFERWLELRRSTLSNLDARWTALSELKNGVDESWEQYVLRILGCHRASCGVRTDEEREVGLSRQQRRALARQREKAQRRAERIASNESDMELAVPSTPHAIAT